MKKRINLALLVAMFIIFCFIVYGFAKHYDDFLIVAPNGWLSLLGVLVIAGLMFLYKVNNIKP